ncbi:MAG TPA: phosphatidate cytidylyltransferase [Candidatus Limnocylindria bacterium]|nr:phosphatidate cytidylyltransferase [Candidatus Limnocylindria bacterium]
MSGTPGPPTGLYRLKPASQRLVGPLADRLAARRVSPDLITWLGVPVAAAGGACLALSPGVPTLLLAVPALAALRLALNLLDGMVARRTARAHAMGEMWNELGDRLADLLFIGGLAWVPGVGPWLAFPAVIAALLASYVGITSRAAGGSRQYGGVMSKPGRMGVLAIAAPVALVAGSDAPLAGAALIIGAGALVTLVQRLVDARRQLHGPAERRG